VKDITAWEINLFTRWTTFLSDGDVKFEFNGMGQYRVSLDDDVKIHTDDLQRAMDVLHSLNSRAYLEATTELKKQIFKV
jgi:hypothetical protein